jgi:hypothetical protein
MKQKTLWILLAAEAAACIVLQILRASFAGAFSAAMAFPFEQIGLWLRALSLSGVPGNIAAWTLYAAVCLAPVAVLLVLIKRRAYHPEDWLLALLSVALFAVLYLMVNPAVISSLFHGAPGLAVGKAVLGGAAYSVLCGYLVLRVLRMFFAGSTDKLQKYMAALLFLMNLLFVYAASGACFGKLLDSIETLRAGNAGNERLLGPSYIFLVLQFAVDALPYILDVFVAFAALRLLDAMRTDRYSQQSVEAAVRLSRLCGAALAAAMIANIAFNLLQLLFAKMLLVINGSVQIPVLSIAFVLAALLLARFAAENKRLKDDNDMFI